MENARSVQPKTAVVREKSQLMSASEIDRTVVESRWLSAWPGR